MSAFALLSLALTFAPQQAGSAPLSPELEMRVHALGKELRCAVCQGLSVADSPAAMARAQLDKVRELVAGGKSDAEVREYFVARYGEWVLLKPRAEGMGVLVWVLPVALLVVGGAIGFGYVIKNQRRERGHAESRLEEREVRAEAEDPYVQAVRSELSR